MNLSRKEFEELLAAAIVAGMVRQAASRATFSEAGAQLEAAEAAANAWRIAQAVSSVKPKLAGLPAFKQALNTVATQKRSADKGPRRVSFTEPIHGRFGPAVDPESVKLAEAATAKAEEIRKENPKLLPHEAFAEALREVRRERG